MTRLLLELPLLILIELSLSELDDALEALMDTLDAELLEVVELEPPMELLKLDELTVEIDDIELFTAFADEFGEAVWEPLHALSNRITDNAKMINFENAFIS